MKAEGGSQKDIAPGSTLRPPPSAFRLYSWNASSRFFFTDGAATMAHDVGVEHLAREHARDIGLVLQTARDR